MAAVQEFSDQVLQVIGDHEKDSFSVFQEMRKLDELCDITLSVNRREIRAHRVVLAACSSYFRAMLTTGFLESNLGTISLQDCDENAVEQLVDFLYTCKMDLNESNVENILAVASLFQIQLVVQKCADFLGTLIRIENCLGIQSLAMQYSLGNLEFKVRSFISWNFLEVSRESEFVLIPPQQLSKIVESDRLHVKMEEDVFEAVIRWYKHDREERRIKYSEIFELVRFPCMSKEYLEKVVLADELILSEDNWKKFVEGAIALLTSPLGSKKRAVTKRKSPNVLYLIGELSCRIETFDLESGSCSPATGMAQTAGCAVAVNEELYVVLGGGTRIEKYDPKLNAWVQVGNGIKESDFDVCESMGSIYVVGGGKRAKSFNIDTRAWSKLPNMSMRRSFHRTVGLLGKVYAIGGTTPPGDKTEASVECFNPASNRWEVVEPMNTARFRHGIAAMKNKIYVVGGFDARKSCLKSAEVFDPVVNTWSFIAPINHPHRDFGVGVTHDMIFVFGGSGANCIESYDRNTNEWNEVGSLATRWNTFRCVSCPLFQF